MKLRIDRSTAFTVFISIYYILFLFCLYGIGITADEYEGGNKLAEFGSGLIYFFWFEVLILEPFLPDFTVPDIISMIILWGLPLVNGFLIWKAGNYLSLKMQTFRSKQRAN